MLILGIDPGIAATGYGIIKVTSGSKLSMVDYGCIKTSKNEIFSQRLLIIYRDLEEIIKKYHPDKISIENIYFAKNMKQR